MNQKSIFFDNSLRALLQLLGLSHGQIPPILDTQGLLAVAVTTTEVTDRKGALNTLYRCKSGLTRVQSLLADGSYVGQPFAQGVSEILGEQVTVQIAKRSELHKHAGCGLASALACENAMKGMFKTLVLASLIVAIAAAGVVYSGAIYIGADQPHLAPVHTLFTLARERSIAVRAEGIRVPPLDDDALVRGGAGNYDAMCVGCHLAPGVEATELNRGLYPQPPKLAERGSGGDPASTFWAIKHGIKASGMPAWGKSMDDPYIWELVAFLERLPRLDAQGYQALVAASGGHRHGGSETGMHHSPGCLPEQPGGEHHGAMPAKEESGHNDHAEHAH